MPVMSGHARAISTATVRIAALGGVVGPVAFVGAWSLGGAVAGGGYSPVHDAVSRLAAVGADTRGLMSAGLVVFGLSLPVYAIGLRRTVGGAAWAAAATTGIATLAVAATPLDHSRTVDAWHAVFAGIGYVSLAATPLLAARPLRRLGHRTLARWGLVAGSIAGAALLATTTGRSTGLFQRVGLTAGDLWILASAVAIARRALPDRRQRG